MTSKKWRNFKAEQAIEPDLPIIDTHHHIWEKEPSDLWEPYGAADLIDDKTGCGHNVVATVSVDSHGQYRTEGPIALRPVGETEYAEKVAQDGERRGGRIAGVCAAIAPHADLCLGSAVGKVLDAHATASPRLRGIRHMLAFVPELPPIYGASEAGISKRADFRQGFAELAQRGLIYEAWAWQPQLDEVLDLARAFPNASIVLNHLGGPLSIGRYAGRRKEGFEDWRKGIAALATCLNVVMKLGGIYLTYTEPDAIGWPPQPMASEKLAELYRDYVLAAIDLFSPARCMFESNFPVDMLCTSYGNLWNSYKRVVAGFTDTERRDMFAGVARRVYKI